MLCGMLRQQAVPARVRCGFAAYFRREWEDHWICEYWRDGRWRRADAQLDRIIAPSLGIDFDLTDLPEDMFITAGEAWRRCRSGEADPMKFGHGEQAVGLWFVRVNVVRDHHSVNGRETSDWDTWRQAQRRIMFCRMRSVPRPTNSPPIRTRLRRNRLRRGSVAEVVVRPSALSDIAGNVLLAQRAELCSALTNVFMQKPPSIRMFWPVM